MRTSRILGAGLAFLVALGAAGAAAWLATPDPVLIDWGLMAEPAAATGGWGAAAAPEPEPLVDLAALAWMAWTPATGAFFLFILACLATMTGLELARPGGHPRDGVLGLSTTRGDRLFISLLGTAYVMLGWLAAMGTPLWGGLAIAVAWWVFVFWKV